MSGAAVLTTSPGSRVPRHGWRLAGRGERVSPSAHVPRSWPLGQDLLLYFAAGDTRSPRLAYRASGPTAFDGRDLGRLWAAGGSRSEVKEEGRAQPGPGDMSGGDRLPPTAREMTRSGTRDRSARGWL